MHWGIAMPNETNDDELIRQFQGGEEREQCFGMLYQRHSQSVLALLRSRCPEAFEDLHQEVWLRVERGLHNYQDVGRGFRSWLFQIARNLVIDRYRRKRPQIVDLTPNPGPVEDNPLMQLIDEEQMQQFRRCFEALPADLAEIVRARLQRVPTEQTRIRLELQSNDQVHRRFHAAKEKLRDCLERGAAA